MNVNEHINFKQYLIIPILGIALITIGWFIGSNKSNTFENDLFSFELGGEWLNAPSTEEGQTSFITVKNQFARTTVQQVEPYVFGIEAGHNLFNDALYDDYESIGTKNIKVKDQEGVYFDLTYNDMSTGEATPMVGKEVVFPVGEGLYSIGMFAPADAADAYLASFDDLVQSIHIK